MHRVVIATVGKKHIHLLKVVGAFLIFGGAFGILDSIAWMFRIIKQIEAVNVNPELALAIFKLPVKALTGDTLLGLFMLPVAVLMLWFVVFCIGTMVYRTGEVIIPKKG
ncbi:MAG: hypothetical protein J7L23_03120 [Candidatus Diapherotrites archaeon]|nr:hypothetical protein [Candidatus Diapherotrites archaeon]